MYPLLFKLGPIPIHTYGFLIALGFLISVWVIRWLAVRSNVKAERAVDLAFWVLLVGFAGSRVMFVLTRPSMILEDPFSIFRIWEGGLVFYGGPIAVIPFMLWYCRRYQMPIWKILDIFSPALVVAHAFGRLGCIASGCCYGRPTESNWGFRFHTELVEPSLRGIFLHPVQAYESAALFMLFAGLMVLHKRRIFDGQIVLTYLIIYPVIRFTMEMFRGDAMRGFLFEGALSTSQFLSLLVICGALITLAWRWKIRLRAHI